MKTFLEFNNMLEQHTKEDLEMLLYIFEKDGLRVESFLDSEDIPYIFIYNPLEDTSFQGVRVYKLGDILAFKVQRYPESKSYGKAYPIEIQDMYDNFIADKKTKEEAVKELRKILCKNMRDFFKKSKVAEDKIVRSQIHDPDALDGAGQIVIRNTGTDYSNTVYSNNKN
jgi:hypothetical protein